MQTERSWLQQNSRLQTHATCKLIAASYPPCVTIHFLWHNSTDVATTSCRVTADVSHKVFIAPIKVQMQMAVTEKCILHFARYMFCHVPFQSF